MYLKSAIDRGDVGEMRNAARAVTGHFRDNEYAIDHFCAPPFHPNGNAWRTWLSQVVTEDVTPELRMQALKLVPTLNV